MSDERTSYDEPAAPPWFERTAVLAWRVVGVGAALYILFWLAGRLSLVIVATLVALVVAAVLEPLVDRLSRRLPRTAVSLAVTLGATALLVAVLAAVGFRVADQVPELADQLSRGLRRLSQYVPGLSSPGSGQDVIGQVAERLQSSPGAAGQVLSAVEQVVRFFAGLFLMLVLVFFFLRDGDRMWRWMVGLVRPERRDDVEATGRAMWSTLGGYIRALATIAAADALGIGIGLLILDVPLVATLVVLTFIGAFIPTIGAFVAGTVAVLVAFVSGGITKAVLTLVLIVVVQQFDNDVLEPMIMGRRLPLHPALVVVAVAIGTLVAGVAGAFLAVPVTAALSAGGHVLRVRHGED